MGGTEASVIRVANGLSSLGHTVRIVFEPEQWGDVTIVVRDPNGLGKIKGPKVLWMHDYLTFGDISQDHQKLAKQATVVAVSDFHKANVDVFLNTKSKRIYNPVCVGVPYDDTKQKRAVILSSPCKGLETSLEVFAAMDRSARLAIFNPGYEMGATINTKRVQSLGSKCHQEAMRHLAGSSLLIHANRGFPETFGLVFAEAKALGVPVLTFDHGAAREVLGEFGSCMPLDTSIKDMAKEGDRLMRTPHRPNPGIFDPEDIAREWQTLLTELTTAGH